MTDITSDMLRGLGELDFEIRARQIMFLGRTGKVRLMSGSNFTSGEWWRQEPIRIPDPLLGSADIMELPDTKDGHLERILDSLRQCPTYGLHNPLYNQERYNMYGRICVKAAQFLRDKGGRDYFANLIQLVMPKDDDQCLAEVDVTAAFLENFSGDGVRFLAQGRTTPGTRPGQEARDYPWPFGPVAVVTPFNFPLEIPALQLMGALFMGNKPLLKPDTKTGIVAEAFVRLLLLCGMPADDMALVYCADDKVAEKLVIDPAIRLIQFTGSSKIADRLQRLSGGRVKKEDSGFDWKLLGPNVIERMVKEVAAVCDQDAYAASGQKCSAQSALFMHDNWMKAGFVDHIRELASARNLSDLTVGPVLTWDNRQIKGHIDRLLKIAGASVLFGGKPLKGHSIPSCYGAFEPTAVFVPLKHVMDNFELVTTEVFAPVQIVTRWESKEDLDIVLHIFEQMKQRLTAAVVDNDPTFCNYVLGRTTNGTTYAGIRARTTGAPQYHFFGPTGHPADTGIGTPDAIRSTWSQNRTIIFDTDSGLYK